MKHTAGDLRERVELLDFTLTDKGWKWVKYAEVWAGVELTGKTCLFSRLGIGARAAELILRSRALTLHQAIRWRGLHLFLSEIVETERGWMDISAAVVEPTECRLIMADALSFPGVLTMKYLGHAQETPMAVGTGDYVLVTPKETKLKPGRQIAVGITEAEDGIGEGRVMLIRTAHTIDPCKNEYELREEMDL